MQDLTTRHCVPCEGGAEPLDARRVSELLRSLDGWVVDESAKKISRVFDFKNFHQTMEFVNALAWVAHREDHHPDLEVAYKRCKVTYSTHAIGGLSDNDFICAAKIDALLL